ncbi:MAG: nicotinate (nicotinamide) nucleotide adenylyltransferase [Clostridia bacterium]|nr:nicotinate (nicotinamide) nucleotide adenylyltransferase [Clostridia bacterium]
MKKIVVLGGAFNPPTIAHFSLAVQIINNFEDLDKVIFMPVNVNYKKDEMPISNEHRFNMLQMVCKDLEKIEVSRLELDFNRVLTTIETLRILKKSYPDRDIVFATGTDNLKEFELWNNCQDILDEFKILVFVRGFDNFENIINSSEFLRKNKSSIIKLENFNITTLSSTFVRENVRNGKSIKFLVPDCVMDYIIKNNLYQ